jgi:hypothetical protein
VTIRPTSGDAGVENDRIVSQILFSRSSVKRERIYWVENEWNRFGEGRSDRIAFDDIHVRNGGGWVVRARRRGALGGAGKGRYIKNKMAGLCSSNRRAVDNLLYRPIKSVLTVKSR